MKFTLFVSLACLILASCAPRGESRSLDEILVSARRHYTAAASAGIKDGVSKKLDFIASNVEAAIDADKRSASSLRAISDSLFKLTSSAGYTSRPALTELAKQYDEMAERAENSVLSKGEVKLLAARTYLLLTSELETGKFAL